jgi:hypothetical protein
MDEQKFLENRFLMLIRRCNIAADQLTQEEAKLVQDLILQEIGIRAGLIPPPKLTKEEKQRIVYYCRQALIAQDLDEVPIKIVDREIFS